ncbi:MAG: biotin--[acetyl-CoA-carboxylase] ligase [Desulfotalea sp.]
MNSHIVHVRDTSSTNTYAKRLIREGCPDGTVVWADNQSEGRGRLGKKWQSAKEKGLYCSIIYYPHCRRKDYTKITLVTGLAVAEVLESIVDKDVMLKWPNDVFIDGKKCGGILCEMVLGSERDAIIIGIGINVLHEDEDFNEDIKYKTTSLKICGSIISIEMLLDEIYRKTITLNNSFCNGEWIDILKEWRQRDFLVGKESEWLLNDGRIKIGRSQGVDEEGLLYIVTDDGIRHQVLSGDVQIKGIV